MKFVLATMLAFAFTTPSFAQAEDFETLAHSCRAKSVDRFYCPVTPDWWNGPFFDRGCSVKCEEGQRAVCVQASCDDGDPVPSSCSCN